MACKLLRQSAKRLYMSSKQVLRTWQKADAVSQHKAGVGKASRQGMDECWLEGKAWIIFAYPAESKGPINRSLIGKEGAKGWNTALCYRLMHVEGFSNSMCYFLYIIHSYQSWWWNAILHILIRLFIRFIGKAVFSSWLINLDETVYEKEWWKS